jgi:endoglucanase
MDVLERTREIHKEIMTKTAEAVWAIDPGRPIIVDGLAGGNLAMPELSDLSRIQSICSGRMEIDKPAV